MANLHSHLAEEITPTGKLGTKEDVLVSLYTKCLLTAFTWPDLTTTPRGCIMCVERHSFSPRGTQFEMFWTCLPLLKLAEGKKVIIMASPPRYICSRFYDDERHERHERHVAAWRARDCLKDLVWTCRGCRKGMDHLPTGGYGGEIYRAEGGGMKGQEALF